MATLPFSCSQCPRTLSVSALLNSPKTVYSQKKVFKTLSCVVYSLALQKPQLWLPPRRPLKLNWFMTDCQKPRNIRTSSMVFKRSLRMLVLEVFTRALCQQCWSSQRIKVFALWYLPTQRNVCLSICQTKLLSTSYPVDLRDSAVLCSTIPSTLSKLKCNRKTVLVSQSGVALSTFMKQEAPWVSTPV